MVLTRLSHVGEVCPLRDHSYSDPMLAPGPSRQLSVVPKGSCRSIPCDECPAVHILDLPNELLETIFSYLSYKKIGEIRLVCIRFNKIGSNMLNSTFTRLLNNISMRYQTTKAQMPRRESARRKHPLAREIDTLETLEMRLALLQMTFGKHIERKYCCFFAGQVLDEVYLVLTYMKSTAHKSKVCKVIDELFDLSTMAMEYFKESLEPILPEISYLASEFSSIATRFSDKKGLYDIPSEGDEEFHDEPPPSSNMVLRKRIRKIRQGMKRCNTQVTSLTREVKSYRSKMNDQQKQIIEYAKKVDQNDQKLEEYSKKFAIILQELNKCKTELQHWRSRSPIHQPLCAGCSVSLRSEWIYPRQELTPPLMEDSLASMPHCSFPGPDFLPSTSNGIKNLEQLFDRVACDDFGATDLCHTLTSSSFDSKCQLSKRLLSDDDSDFDSDTVGKRVKERKRIKVDCH